MSSMPNQSATRIMVPKLPGSWTVSSAKVRCWAAAFLSRWCWGFSNTASADCGDWRSDAFAISSLSAVMTSSAWAVGCSSRNAWVQTKVRHRKMGSRSDTSLFPSARKVPDSSLSFFFARDAICRILFLLRFIALVIPIRQVRFRNTSCGILRRQLWSSR